MRQGQVFEIDTLERLEKVLHGLHEGLQFPLAHHLDVHQEFGCALYLIRGVNLNVRLTGTESSIASQTAAPMKGK